MGVVPEPWEIWRVWWADGHPAPKFKRILVVYTNSVCVAGLFINSEQRTQLLGNPEMEVCDLQVPAAGNGYLEYDSWIHCGELWEFPFTDAERRLGIVTGDVRNSVIRAVNACPVLKPRTKKAILRCLSPANV